MVDEIQRDIAEPQRPGETGADYIKRVAKASRSSHPPAATNTSPDSTPPPVYRERGLVEQTVPVREAPGGRYAHLKHDSIPAALDRSAHREGFLITGKSLDGRLMGCGVEVLSVETFDSDATFFDANEVVMQSIADFRANPDKYRK